MITVSLMGAEFFAHHGFYPEEQVLGNKFIVDIEVRYTPINNIKEDNINHIVDYEKIYDIAAANMKQTRKLIETAAQFIADEVKHKYPFADCVKVSIKKMAPPLNGKVEYSAIEIII